MRRQCKYCGRFLPEDSEYEFCSATCHKKYRYDVRRGKLKRTCTECGRRFDSYGDRWGSVCSRCIYKKNYKADPKPTPTASAGSGIDEVVAEQQRIFRETGRHITYGEIMAARRKGKGKG